MKTDFDYGIIKSCLKYPDVFKTVKPALDKCYNGWTVYDALVECAGISGRSLDYKHDIFYKSLCEKLKEKKEPDYESVATDELNSVNKQSPDEGTLINRVKLLVKIDNIEKIKQETAKLQHTLSSDSPTDDKLLMFQDFCNKQLSKMSIADTVVTVSDRAGDILQTIRSKSIGLPTGYYLLDKLTSGIKPGELILIGGAPSMGKTSFAMNCAVNMSLANNKVLFVSLEMTEDEVIERIISSLSKVPLHKILENNLSRREQARLDGTMATLTKLDLKIISKCGVTPGDITTYIHSVFKTKPDCVFIDYLQLMNDDGQVSNRYEKITNISNKLKAIALNTKVPIVALGQLNRGISQTGVFHRPKMSDFRDSGSLEQDANKILLIYREDYYRIRENKANDVDGRATIIIEKNRQGPQADLDFVWIPEFFLYEELPETIGRPQEKQNEEPEAERQAEETLFS